jgi:putative tryptophan/tyrosine transport system substrate-binding protein
MRRRDLIGILASTAILLSRSAPGQQPRRARVAWLTVAPHPFIAGFLKGMQELGWIEHETLDMDYAYADGRPERLTELAGALARGSSDVIVASGSDAVATASAMVKSIPIVGISSTMGSGGNLGRPTGNLTGIALLYDEIAAKWPELLVEVLPSAKSIGVFYDLSAANKDQVAGIQRVAAAVGRQLVLLPVRGADEIEPNLARAEGEAVPALIFVSSPVFTANAAHISELVGHARLPAVFESRVFVEKGGLMSYGPDLNETFRRLAYYVDRILKGSRPSDLPIEQPTKFELLINLKTAKALNLTIPQSILARADEVIE